MHQVWQWIIAGVALAMAADYLLDVLPKLLPSLVILAVLAVVLRLVWARTRW